VAGRVSASNVAGAARRHHQDARRRCKSEPPWGLCTLVLVLFELKMRGIILLLLGSSPSAAFVIPAEYNPDRSPLRCGAAFISTGGSAIEVTRQLREAGRCEASQAAALTREGISKLLAIGQARDGPVASTLLAKAAEAGDPLSMHAIGVISALGCAPDFVPGAFHLRNMRRCHSWDDGRTGSEETALNLWEACAKASGFPLCHLSAALYHRVGAAGGQV
jgi:hypothetical protein